MGLSAICAHLVEMSFQALCLVSLGFVILCCCVTRPEWDCVLRGRVLVMCHEMPSAQNSGQGWETAGAGSPLCVATARCLGKCSAQSQGPVWTWDNWTPEGAREGTLDPDEGPDEGPGRTVDVEGDGGRDTILQVVHRLQTLGDVDAAPQGLCTPTGKDSLLSACGLVMPRHCRGRIVFLAAFQRNNAFLRECIMRTFHNYFGSFRAGAGGEGHRIVCKKKG